LPRSQNQLLVWVVHEKTNPSVLEPSSAKTSSLKSLHDIRATPDNLPNKLRLIIFNHHEHRTFVQPEYPGRNPGVQIRVAPIPMAAMLENDPGWVLSATKPLWGFA
jgi:hypothetical protein